MSCVCGSRPVRRRAPKPQQEQQPPPPPQQQLEDAIHDDAPAVAVAALSEVAVQEAVPPARTRSRPSAVKPPATPLSDAKSQSLNDSVQCTPKPAAMPAPPNEHLSTPDWAKVLKDQGLDSGMITDSMRRSRTQSADESGGSALRTRSRLSPAIPEDEEEEPEPAPEPPADPSLLCKIDVQFNTKFGKWDKESQGKLFAQLVAAGTDEKFARKVVIAMKQNKGKVSVRGPMANHAPAFTVFRSIPSLNVGLQTPSKVDQTGRRRGQPAAKPLRTGGPCAVKRLPGGKFAAVRKSRNGLPIVKARTISPPRSSAAPARDPPPLPSESTSAVAAPAAKVATPRVGVRALQSPARLVAESFAQGARLKGRMFKVQETTAVTKLVMPSSSEVSASTRCAFAGATYPLLT